jgi:hypothetical protein
MAVQILVKGAFYEKAMGEECQAWATQKPEQFQSFRAAMDQARSSPSFLQHGRLDYDIPNDLFERIARRFGENGKLDMLWTRQPELVKAFKAVFLVGLYTPSRPV